MLECNVALKKVQIIISSVPGQVLSKRLSSVAYPG